MVPVQSVSYTSNRKCVCTAVYYTEKDNRAVIPMNNYDVLQDS